MSAQRYASPVAHERMSKGLCPECGGTAESHSNDPRFWMPDKVGCSLLARGVMERIDQFRADRAEVKS